MKTIMPDYYASFSCLMGACRHSCCIGWEIDIDDDTLERYRKISGSIGEKLARCIDQSGETAFFRLTEKERCPFLTDGGLCELILTLGEDSLCQICADHPRFRSFFTDRTEIGLGLCCEAAARLILMRSEPVRLIKSDDDGLGEVLEPDEIELLSLRSRLTEIVQNRSYPISQRIREMLSEISAESFTVDYVEWAQRLLELERLDEAWTEHLNALLASGNDPIDASPLNMPAWDAAFEQLMVYLLYRHLPDALYSGDIKSQVLYCALIWALLRRMLLINKFQNMEQLIELSRLYSSEIEYSDENLNAIHSALTD